ASPWSWWEGRRRLFYNLVLVAALGLGALLLMAWMAVSLAREPLPVSADGELPEITVFTVVFQALACFVGLVAANVFYTAGPLVEGALPRAIRPAYRRWCYPAGILFSLLVILALPAAAVVSLLFG